jgi:hypothetical protein
MVLLGVFVLVRVALEVEPTFNFTSSESFSPWVTPTPPPATRVPDSTPTPRSTVEWRNVVPIQSGHGAKAMSIIPVILLALLAAVAAFYFVQWLRAGPIADLDFLL